MGVACSTTRWKDEFFAILTTTTYYREELNFNSVSCI